MGVNEEKRCGNCIECLKFGWVEVDGELGRIGARFISKPAHPRPNSSRQFSRHTLFSRIFYIPIPRFFCPWSIATFKNMVFFSINFLLIRRFNCASLLTLVMMGGGFMCPPPHFVFIFLLKISPPDQTLRPTCKFLILGIFYHAIFFSSKNLLYKKFYYINSSNFLN